MKYENATWRIKLQNGAYVEVSVKGLDDDRSTSTPHDVIVAGQMLADVGRAIERIRQRWLTNTTQMESKSA